jgi:hypothetical protein
MRDGQARLFAKALAPFEPDAPHLWRVYDLGG